MFMLTVCVCAHRMEATNKLRKYFKKHTHTYTHIRWISIFFFLNEKVIIIVVFIVVVVVFVRFSSFICCVVCAKMNGKKNNNKKDLKLTKLSVFFLTISSMYVVLARRVVSVFQFFFLFLLFSPVFFVRFIWKSQSFRSFFLFFLALLLFFLKALVHHQTHTHILAVCTMTMTIV